jgi:hypothetical protein
VTTDRSNFCKHNKTKKHIEKTQPVLTPKRKKGYENRTVNKMKDSIEQVNCIQCNERFTSELHLHRHIILGGCNSVFEKIKNLENNLDEYKQLLEAKELELEAKEIEMENKFLKQEVESLKEFIMSGKGGHTYNISVKNYVQSEYPDAPPLRSLPNYCVPLCEYKAEEAAHDDYDLMDVIIFNQEQKTLAKYLGDFLIDHYRKDNPAEQSIWNSDAARLTYVVKELIGNRSRWKFDKDGVKTASSIIDPLLEYIDSLMKAYLVKNKGKVNNNYALAKMQAVQAIRIDIENTRLSKNILKYIAPSLCAENLEERLKSKINSDDPMEYQIIAIEDNKNRSPESSSDDDIVVVQYKINNSDEEFDF